MTSLRIFTLLFVLVAMVQPAYSDRKTVPEFVVPNVTPSAALQKIQAEPALTFLEKTTKNLEEHVYANWEPSGLQQNKVVSITSKIDPDGNFSDIKLVRTTGFASADFAAVEAVAESSGFQLKLPSELLKSSSVRINLFESKRRNKFDCATTYRKKHHFNGPVWHLIPPEALQRVKDLPDAAIHCEKNLRTIKAAFIDSKQLDDARAEWNKFLRTDKAINAKDIRIEAKAIEAKYAYIFEKMKSDVTDPPSKNFD